MNPKTEAILEQVRILAQTYPDFEYTYNSNTTCQYNDGGDSKYPELCGCIIGQAARRAGIDTSDWDKIPNETKLLSPGIRCLITDRLGEDRYSLEAEILSCIQSMQDIGTSWGKAYNKAIETAELG